MRSQKTGGKVLLKPEALNEKQRTRVGINNLLKASFGKSGRSLGERLARECVAVVAGGDSESVRAKESVHKLATANR